MVAVIGIDPGTYKSAWVTYCPDRHEILAHGYAENEELLDELDCACNDFHHVAIEMVASYGMAVGRETFETCMWIGRFIERWKRPYTLLYRKKDGACPAITSHLCKSSKAKDANVRQAILDRFPATGGGKVPQVGVKKQPGPLFGISTHEWSALAVALTYAETQGVTQ